MKSSSDRSNIFLSQGLSGRLGLVRLKADYDEAPRCLLVFSMINEIDCDATFSSGKTVSYAGRFLWYHFGIGEVFCLDEDNDLSSSLSKVDVKWWSVRKIV